MTSSTPPRTPRQARSRDTEERILGAMHALVAEKPYDQVSIQDIAARAGVSVGGFYARFASKDDALLHLSYAGYVAESIAAADRVLAPERWEGAPLGELVRAYFELVSEAGRAHLAIVREMVQRTRANPSEVAGHEPWTRFQEHVHAPFRRMLQARAGEMTHPDPDLAISFAFSACSSALREATLFPHMQPAMSPAASARLVDELSRMFCAYLGVPLPADPTSTES